MNSISNQPRAFKGMTLLEVIVVLAVLMALVGVIVPLGWQELERSRNQATQNELDNIKEALLAFYEDINAFPPDVQDDPGGIELGYLLSNPEGWEHWNGPYLSSFSKYDLISDAWGNPYIYDRAPTINGATDFDAFILSYGANQAQDMSGSIGDNWVLGSAGDDIYILVSRRPTDREKLQKTLQKIERLEKALRFYYSDMLAFPERVNYDCNDYKDLRFPPTPAPGPTATPTYGSCGEPEWKGPYLLNIEEEYCADEWNVSIYYNRLEHYRAQLGYTIDGSTTRIIDIWEPTCTPTPSPTPKSVSTPSPSQ